MSRTRGWGLLLLLLAALPAWGAKVQLSTPTHELQLDQGIAVRVVVIDGRPTGVPDLTTPEGLTVTYLNQTTGYRDVAGVTTSFVVYDFAVQATALGTWTLGPAIVHIGGTPLESSSLELTVVERSTPQEDPIVASAEVSTDSAWEGQVLTYTYEVQSRIRLLDVHWTQLPVNGLVRPRNASPRTSEYVVDDPDGALSVHRTIEAFLIGGAEDLELPPAVAAIEIRSTRPRRPAWGVLTPTERVVLATDAQHIDVRPLPPAPAGFTGLVGEVEVTSKVSTSEVAVGGSVDWQIKIAGDASLDGFALPDPGDIAGVRVYDGELEVGTEVEEPGQKSDSGFYSQGVVKRVLVPTEPGELRIPTLEIVTFSPERGEFVTHTIDGPVLEVVPGREGSGKVESFAPAGVAPTDQPVAEADDVFPIRARGTARVARLAPVLPWVFTLLGVAIAAVLGRDGWAAWSERRARSRAPAPDGPPDLVRLDQLPEDGTDALATLDLALRRALARRLQVPLARLDADTLGALPDDVAAQVREVRRALDRARFGGESTLEGLHERVRAVLARLEEAA